MDQKNVGERMSCCTNTEYGSLSYCGAAAPWPCGKQEKLHEEHIVDIQNLALSTLSYQELKTHVQTLQYFPTEGSRFLQLVYLVHLKDEQSPYSRSDLIIFKRSDASDRLTKNWLRGAFIAIFVFAVAAWGLTKSDSPLAEAAIVILSIIGGIVSWIATGSNPDFKSDSANARQDRLAAVPETLLQIGRALVQLKIAHPDLATKLAEELDLKKIQEKMVRDDARAQGAPDLTALESAKCYVLGKEIPERTPVEFEAYLNSLGSVCLTCPLPHGQPMELP